MDDLKQVIALYKESIRLTPTGHLVSVMYLYNLGHSLEDLFKCDGSKETLNEAIEAYYSTLLYSSAEAPATRILLKCLEVSIPLEGSMECRTRRMIWNCLICNDL